MEFHGSPAKHRAIMDAAARVFLRQGYAGASVDAIAAEAGVSKRTVESEWTMVRAWLRRELSEDEPP